MKKSDFRLLIAYTIILINLSTQKNFATDYYINFKAEINDRKIDSIIVKNITLGNSITIYDYTTLHLTDNINDIIPPHSNNIDFCQLYPNPITEFALLKLNSEVSAKCNINIYGIDGKMLNHHHFIIHEGTNYVRISLPQGIYIIKIQSEINSAGCKIVSKNSTNTYEINTISFVDQKLVQKYKSENVKFIYNEGDQLIFEAYSDSSVTILPDIPVSDKTLNFAFIKCKDADGNNYKIVRIGNQVWMAENLKTTKFRNGSSIQNITNDADWRNTNKAAFCDYNNISDNGLKYGHLYNWYAVIDSLNIAPLGWKIPNESEWLTLENYLIANGFNYEGSTTGNKFAKSLAATDTWTISTNPGAVGNNLNKNNKTGFSALPAGYRSEYVSFNFLKDAGYWWTATEKNSTEAKYKYLTSSGFDLTEYYTSKKVGFSVRCIKAIELPVLKTKKIEEVSSTTVKSGGEIMSDGGEDILSCGLCWNTTGNPTINDFSKKSNTLKDFSLTITGLSPNTKYYLRAYATNSSGTSYGNEFNFTTWGTSGTVTDIDGNQYKTITFGTQIWMVENLRTTRFRNGNKIPTVSGSITNVSTSVYQWIYDNDTTYLKEYGRLYTWWAVNDTSGLAPSGWHIPSDNEWTTLQNYLIANGYNYDETTIENKIAKSLAATKNWNSSTNEGAVGNDLSKNNRCGFTAFPSGSRFSSGSFHYMGLNSNWWTSNQFDNANAYFRNVNYDKFSLNRDNFPKNYGFSVRCIKD